MCYLLHTTEVASHAVLKGNIT